MFVSHSLSHGNLTSPWLWAVQVLSASSAQLEAARRMEEELASENADLQRQLADAREACNIAGAWFEQICP